MLIMTIDGKPTIMSMAPEKFKLLQLLFETAAKTNNMPLLELVLAQETVEQSLMHMLTGELREFLEPLFQITVETGNVQPLERMLTHATVQRCILDSTNAILLAAVRNGCTYAVQRLIELNLVKNLTFYNMYSTDHSNICKAIQHAIAACHLEMVKLLVPLDDHYCFSEFYLPEKLTKENLETIKFLLTLPQVKNKLGSTPKKFFVLVKEAILAGNLEMTEGLLEATSASMLLYHASNLTVDHGYTNGLQLAADLGHFEIVHCLANALQSAHLQPDSFFTTQSIQRIPYFENLTITIQGEPVSIVTFLKNYQEQLLQKIANSTPFSQPLNNLIMEYLYPNPVVFSLQPTILDLISNMEKYVTEINQPNSKELAEKANTAIEQASKQKQNLLPQDIANIEKALNKLEEDYPSSNVFHGEMTQRIARCREAFGLLPSVSIHLKNG